MLFLTSVFAALLSFHNGVARYLFALGRERVLPAALSRVSTRSGGPVAGSLAQTPLAVVVLAIFALAGADPVLELFTWLSRHRGGRRGPADGGHVGRGGRLLPRPARRRRRCGSGSIAPTLATIALVALVVLIIGNFDALLGTDPTSPLRWILPGMVLLAAVARRALGAAAQVVAAGRLRRDRHHRRRPRRDDDEAVVLDLPRTPRHSL